MFSMSFGQTRLYVLIGLFFLLALVNGQTPASKGAVDKISEWGANAQTAKNYEAEPQAVAKSSDEQPHVKSMRSTAKSENHQTNQASVSGVLERISQFKTPKELLERTKIFPVFQDDLSKLKSVEVTATGYSAGRESTGKNPGHPEYGITFSGVQVRRDIFSTIAADPQVFPLGTLLWIPGYGYAVVADTGSAIKGKKLDLYFETKDQVFKEWGKKQVNVLIVKPGNGKVTEDTMVRLNNIWSGQTDLKNLL